MCKYGELRWFRYSFVTVEEHCKARTPCGEYREFVWFLYSAIIIFKCSKFDINMCRMQFVFSVPSDGRRAPQGATLCGGHREHNFWAMHSSGFFASMVNSFSLVLQNLWMLSQCSLYSATLLCQACLSFMWPRSMPSNRAIFPSLPFGIFPCVSSNRSRRWTWHITKTVSELHTLPN